MKKLLLLAMFLMISAFAFSQIRIIPVLPKVGTGWQTLPPNGTGNASSNSKFNGMVQAVIAIKTGTDTTRAAALWNLFPSPELLDTGTIVVQDGYLFYYDGAHWISPSTGGGGSQTLDQTLINGNTSTTGIILSIGAGNTAYQANLSNGGGGFFFNGGLYYAYCDDHNYFFRNTSTGDIVGMSPAGFYFQDASNNLGSFVPPYVMGNYSWHPQAKSGTLADSTDLAILAAEVAGIIVSASYLPPYIDAGDNSFSPGHYIYVDTASGQTWFNHLPGSALRPGIFASGTNMVFIGGAGADVYFAASDVWNDLSSVRSFDMNGRAGYASDGTTKLFDFPSTFNLYSLPDGASNDSNLVIRNNVVKKVKASAPLAVVDKYSTTGASSTVAFGGVTAATAFYQICPTLRVTFNGVASLSVSVAYVDETGNAQTQLFYPQGSASTSVGAVQNYAFSPMIIHALGGTTITLSFNAGGPIAFNPGGEIIQLP